MSEVIHRHGEARGKVCNRAVNLNVCLWRCSSVVARRLVVLRCLFDQLARVLCDVQARTLLFTLFGLVQEKVVCRTLPFFQQMSIPNGHVCFAEVQVGLQRVSISMCLELINHFWTASFFFPKE